MDKSFKPKKMTRKEWQDNRPLFLKGLGVGAALDDWQKHIAKANYSVGTFAAILKDVEHAIMVVGKLKLKIMAAIKVCKKQIGDHKGTIAGLDNYLKVADDTHSDLLKRHAFESKMSKLSDKPTVDMILKDSKLTNALSALLKATHDEPFLDTYILVHKKNKIAEAVKKYGPRNDYNIGHHANKALVAHYVKKDATVTDKALKDGEKTLRADSFKLMRGICDRLMGQEFGAGFVRKAYGI
ncbi:hypothetical protein [Epibacterium sp. Ofav1-8]|uniref:hypothetical protein n=1 Tax=Epibacterium sp. Ofav1-8 TaxID=2917735 RepID=UPI001EF6B082|nr:hypothetical protein [Epibacterium sp. Ofav1-8]